jgi:hypothetical protein
MIMLFNQFIDMPHLSGGWIILAKGNCSQTGMETNLTSLYIVGSFISAHETNTLHVVFIFLFNIDSISMTCPTSNLGTIHSVCLSSLQVCELAMVLKEVLGIIR